MAVGGLPVVPAIVSVFGVVALAIGGLFVYNGWALRKRGKYVADARTVTADALEPGLAKLTGTARPVDGGATVDAPVESPDPVVATVGVERYKDGLLTVFEGWETLYETSERVPFVLEDDTGRVRVDPPADGTVDIETETDYVSASETTPPAVASYLKRVASDRTDLQSDSEARRYATGAVEPGDEVVVVGEIGQADAGWDDQFAVGAPPQAEDFLVSDKSLDKLTSGRKTGGIIYYAIGGFFLFIGAMLTFVPWIAGVTIS